MPKWDNKTTEDLFLAILSLKNLNEAKRFFRDLLTEPEIIEFAKRWQTAQMLAQKVPYSKIERKTGLSSTTVARVSRWLNKGRDGYKLMLKRLKKQNLSTEVPRKLRGGAKVGHHNSSSFGKGLG